jgi:hypothetical protein
LRITPSQHDIDRSRRDLPGDLARGVAEHTQHHEPHRGVDRGAEPLGDGAGGGVIGLRGGGELRLKIADVPVEVHDTTVAPPWCHRKHE